MWVYKISGCPSGVAKRIYEHTQCLCFLGLGALHAVPGLERSISKVGWSEGVLASIAQSCTVRLEVFRNLSISGPQKYVK